MQQLQCHFQAEGGEGRGNRWEGLGCMEPPSGGGERAGGGSPGKKCYCIYNYSRIDHPACLYTLSPPLMPASEHASPAPHHNTEGAQGGG